jgi:hypothetical protein
MKSKYAFAACATICTLFVLALLLGAPSHGQLSGSSLSVGSAWPAPPDGGGNIALSAWPAPPDGGGNAWPAPPDGGGNIALSAWPAPPDGGGNAWPAPPDGGGNIALSAWPAPPRMAVETRGPLLPMAAEISASRKYPFQFSSRTSDV